MKCEKVRTRLSAFLDGELSSTERAAVARHIDRCEGCANELKTLTGVLDFLDQWNVEPCSIDIRATTKWDWKSQHI